MSAPRPGLVLCSRAGGWPLGDCDNDGDGDIAVAHINARPSLLRNDMGGEHNYLAVRTIGVESNRDGVGTRIRVCIGPRGTSTGGAPRRQLSVEPRPARLFWSRGASAQADEVEVRWPSGKVQQFDGVLAGQVLTAEEPR